MTTYTNSESVTYNDDGTITTKVEYTERPPTKKEQAVAWAAIVGVSLIAVSPIIWESSIEWRERRKLSKLEKKNEKAAKEATEN